MNKPASYSKLELKKLEWEKICTSQRWKEIVLQDISTHNQTELSYLEVIAIATRAFEKLSETDWLEAFAGHPMIGDISSLKAKYSQGKNLSEQEQAQVQHAPEQVLDDLLKRNREYIEKFGFIFIVCARNKSAQEMLSLLNQRIKNQRSCELTNAAAEQRKISQLRMEAML